MNTVEPVWSVGGIKRPITTASTDIVEPVY